MTRRQDSAVVKAKRQVVRMHGQLSSVLDQISMFIDYPYLPDMWDKIIPTLDEEQQEIHKVTRERHDIASSIVALKSKKSQLRSLVANGNATRTQLTQFNSIKSDVADAISKMSAQPELGSTYAEYESLPDTFKRKSVGHPKVTLQEVYVSTMAELNMALANVHNAERQEVESGDSDNTEFKYSTIESILDDGDKLSVNAGRKTLSGPVSDIEELERKKRNILKLIEEIEAEDEPVENSSKRGRKRRSKEERISDKASLLSDIQSQISGIEGGLTALESANRHKRVLEREKRYARQENNKSLVTKITKKLKAIEKAITDKESNAISDSQLIKRVSTAITGVNVTIDEMVDKFIDVSQATSEALDSETIEGNEEDILETMHNMELPEF